MRSKQEGEATLERVRALAEDAAVWWYDEDDNAMVSVFDLRAALGPATEVRVETKRLAYRAFMAGATACYDIPGQKTLDAAFKRFWGREAER